MPIKLSELKRRGTLAKVAIRSMDLSLYQAEVEIDGLRQIIAGKDGKPLRSFNLLDMKRELAALDIAELVLVQESAYDEMVGQPGREGSNAMELPLSAEVQPVPPWLN
jgi:hypothetical protein